MSSSSLFQTYNRSDLSFERGEGVWLYAADGRRYMDCASGIAVSGLGHAYPPLVKALQEQAAKLWHVSNLYNVPQQEKLGELLTSNSFADRVFFCNSGTEAIEGAIKTARRYHHDKGQKDRYRILTFENAFHGRTLAALAAGGQEKYLEGFGPKAEGFYQVPHGDIEAVKAAVDETTAAILLEPVQGEGGIRPFSPAFLRELRALCDATGTLLVFDEIQCGVGRTGKLFAHEWAGVIPDIMAIAKGIGGGFPLGAFLATAEAAAPMQPGTHGTTYGGNLLAMACGITVMETVLAEGFLQGVREKGLLLKQKLASIVDTHPQVFELVRGEGLMLGLKCKASQGEVVAAMREEGLLPVPAGDNVVRIMPPMIISPEEIDQLVEATEKAASRVEAFA
ncbi:aspartate aminotransferase family protein [Polycladidibacter hongkongensis]|uniref:aspartate aminotransferase family protein n=1 Tax=Polycladidibacter hongkongensis TaxID=1647556 RepID=UPI00082ED4CA|nr:aspartate aminotransferase family protein [Pseudovibrio hongkongensis]